MAAIFQIFYGACLARERNRLFLVNEYGDLEEFSLNLSVANTDFLSNEYEPISMKKKKIIIGNVILANTRYGHKDTVCLEHTYT